MVGRLELRSRFPSRPCCLNSGYRHCRACTQKQSPLQKPSTSPFCVRADAQTQCCPAAHRPRRNSLSTAWRDTKGGGGQRAPGGSLLDAFFFFGGGDGDDLFPSPLGRRQPFDLLAKLEEPPLGGKACYTLSASSFVSRGPEGVEYREAHACRTGPGGVSCGGAAVAAFLWLTLCCVLMWPLPSPRAQRGRPTSPSTWLAGLQVREAQSVVQDGRTGRRSMSVTRGLGERERTVTRVRDAGGRVMGDERLRGIAKDQTDRCAAARVACPACCACPACGQDVLCCSSPCTPAPAALSASGWSRRGATSCFPTRWMACGRRATARPTAACTAWMPALPPPPPCRPRRQGGPACRRPRRTGLGAWGPRRRRRRPLIRRPPHLPCPGPTRSAAAARRPPRRLRAARARWLATA